MPEISPGSQFDRSQGKSVVTWEELISLLSRAAEFEQGLACASQFTAYSLKSDTSEGGLTEVQAETVRGWRRNLVSAAAQRVYHLAQISNLLTALGAAPRMTRPTFPLPTLAHATGIGLTLEPFSQATIERLATYEQRGASGDVYDRIAMGLRDLPAKDLFIGPPEAQEKSRLLNLGAQLIAVVDNTSASAALARIVGTGGEAAYSDPRASSGVCETIRAEYAATVTSARQTGLPFEPVRTVRKQSGRHLSEAMADGTRIVDPLTGAVADLFNSAYDTMLLMLQCFFATTEATGTDFERLAPATLRLMSSVIRPLGEALTRMPVDSASLPGLCAGAPFGDASEIPALTTATWTLFDERLWHMAKTATTLRVVAGVPTELQEATAALQDLACQFASTDDPHSVDARINELQQIQAELDSVIQSSVNGPYLVTNVDSLRTWLGESIPARPQMALCRCGGSAIKPFCDGTHAYIDFTGQKDPKRVSDHRDTYVGTAVTVFDNRGICAHSGFCTDRLSSAFHQGQEPFVIPSGARMDEIIRAVRACPSGALSYAIDGIEARNQVDQARQPTIEVSKDGPYRITGGIVLKDGQGNDEPRNVGTSYEHYSLCRCGHSQNKPFCSGMHWYVNFHDPQPAPDREPTLFEWAGGLPVLNRMTRLFYDKYVPQDPLLSPLFGEMSPDHPERVARWLGEVFGGPKNYSEQYGGYSRMLSQHIGKGLSEVHRVEWVNLLCRAADEAGLPADPEFRSAFVSYIEWGSRLAVENSTSGAHPPLHMPMPRWNWGTAGSPGSRISAFAPTTEVTTVALPAANEPVHFAQHIKSLFRPMDRNSMKWAFDLWSYKDVAAHADGILQRLRNGSMPCDGVWPPEKREVFQRWIEAGMPE